MLKHWFPMVVSLFLFCPISASAMTPRADLEAEMGMLQRILDGKLLRHRDIRDRVSRFFQDEDGRDRFLVNFAAQLKRAGVRDSRIRRTGWEITDFDPDYGYAEARFKACGNGYLWIPRCIHLAIRWRRIGERWFLLAPETIRLDPDREN